jgi:hypothetical protein
VSDDETVIVFYAKDCTPGTIREKVEHMHQAFASMFLPTYAGKVPAFHALNIQKHILADVILWASRDIDKMLKDGVTPNTYRQAGTFGVWIKRLKPVVSFAPPMLGSSKYILHCNELFALYVAFLMIYSKPPTRTAAKNEPKTENIFFPSPPPSPKSIQDNAFTLLSCLTDDIFNDLISILRYRIVSRHALAFMLQLLCEKNLHKL